MKRAIGLAIVIVSTCFLIPSGRAQAGDDMRSDRNAIREGNEAVRHDQRELRGDLRRGDYGAAARERDELEHRRQGIREEREDLRNDWRNHRYYEDRESDRHRDDHD